MKKKFTSRNYAKALEIITPRVYIDEDLSLSGQGVDLIDQIINSHLAMAANFGNVLFVSSTANLANMSNVSGIAPYFVKQNDITNINGYKFENDILHPLGYTLNDYTSSSEFQNFLSGTLLPKIVLNDPNLALNTSAASGYWGTNSDSSSTHEYLADSLGWLYFLNTSANGGLSYEPSSYVLSSLVQKTYLNKDLRTVDGIKGLTNYIWRNYATCSLFSNLNLIPIDYLSGTDTYTSGTQQLEKLETLIDVAYSPELFEKDDTRVQEVFENLISTSALTTSSTESVGPFYRFLKALGFSFGNVHQGVEKLDFIYDINNCPEEYLKELANLIGWKLFGYDPSRWRLQLRKAIEIYKATGTKKALQLAINSIFADETFDLSGGVTELYESYLPNLIYYALATYSPAFANRESWTRGTSSKLRIPEYSYNNFDENIRNYVDYILLDLVQTNPDNFIFSGTTFPISKIINSKNGKFFCSVPDQLKYKDYSFIPESFEDSYKDALLKGAIPFWGPDGHGVYVLGKDALLEEDCEDTDRDIYLEYIRQNSDFVFNYRKHHNFPIPPFEEFLYYKDTKITQELINRLIDRLSCIGVTDEGVSVVSEYILNNSIRATDDIRSTNTFLLFTSSLQTPPNFQEVLSSSSLGKSEFLSLWNGKSSHFRISFDAGDFDFLSKAQSKTSAFALLDSARIAEKFSPAHAIPLIDAFISVEDSNTIDSNSSDSLINFKQEDSYLNHKGAINKFGTCSVDSRALYPDANFKRADFDSVADPLFSSLGGVFSLPRNAHRRRDYKNLLPNDGLFFRDGFSMPVSLDASTLEESFGTSSLGFLPLGYIPSAGKFYPIDDYLREDRGPYDSCETLDSANTFSGVATSNTYPCRGLNAVATASGASVTVGSNYTTRDTIPDIYAVYHKLGEAKKLDEASLYVSSNFDSSVTNFYKTHYWKNNAVSYANSSTQTSGDFPDSHLDYEQFSVGLGPHKLYKYYTNVFRRHSLGSPNFDSDGGPNVFSHTYGPLLYNGKFNVDGSAVSKTLATSSLINKGVVDVTLVDLLSEVYSGASGILGPNSVGVSGTFVADSYQDIIVPLVGPASPLSSLTVSGAEFRNKHILSGVEFVGTSGAASSNNFQIYNLDSSNYNRYRGNYGVNNTLIKCKSIDGLPRIRFDLAKSYTASGVFSPPYVSQGPDPFDGSCGSSRTGIDYFSNTSNFLIPEHEFKLQIKALTGRESKPVFGESQFSVWIHTGLDSEGFYSYWNGSSWSKFDARNVTRNEITQNQSTSFSPEKTYPKEILDCYDKVTNAKYLVNNPEIILDLEEHHFDTFELDFHTINNNFCGLDVHTYDQEYYVEIFMNPSISEGKDTFLLLDKVNIKDKTLANLAKISSSPVFILEQCPAKVETEICPEELRKLFIFYNKVASTSKGSGLATRIAADSVGNFCTSGGSRLSYRISPAWVSSTQDADHVQITGIEIEN